MFSWYIIFYIFLAGTGAGAFLCGLAVNGAEGFEALLRGDSRGLGPATSGFLVAAVCFPLACAFLFFDIGRPEQLLGVLANPLQSLVSVGAWLMMLSALVSVAFGFLLLARRLGRGALMALGGVGAILSVAVLIYTGLLLSTMPSVDLWNTWLLVALFAISGVTCGVAATEGVGILLDGSRRRNVSLARARDICAAVEALVLAAFLLERFFATQSARQAVLRLLGGDCTGAFLGGVVLVGLVVPFAASALHRALETRGLLLAGAACTLVGGLALRWCVVEAAVVEAVALGPLFA